MKYHSPKCVALCIFTPYPPHSNGLLSDQYKTVIIIERSHSLNI